MSVAGDLKEIYDCGEVNSEEIDKALNNSNFLSYDGENDTQRQLTLKHRKLVEGAASRINGEWGWVRRDLTLRIKLHDLENDTNSRVRYIEISSKYTGNIIECYYDNDEIVWVFSKTCKRLELWNFLKHHKDSIAKACTAIGSACYSSVFIAIILNDVIVPWVKEYFKPTKQNPSSNNTSSTASQTEPPTVTLT